MAPEDVLPALDSLSDTVRAQARRIAILDCIAKLHARGYLEASDALRAMLK